MYRIELSSEAKNNFRKLKISHRIAVGFIINDLKENPHLGKPLGRELMGRYSYRINVYRIVYKISTDDNLVTIITVGHRSKVYN